jgi:hypothetical protein
VSGVPTRGWPGTAPVGRPPSRIASPHHQPRRTAPAVTARIVAARYERRTAWAIGVQLQVPRSTVAAVLARAGLNRLARLTPPPPSPAMNGRIEATWSIWMSNRWRALPEWATGFTAIAGRR